MWVERERSFITSWPVMVIVGGVSRYKPILCHEGNCLAQWHRIKPLLRLYRDFPTFLKSGPGAWELGKNHLDHQNWRKLDAVQKNWTAILNGLKPYKKLAAQSCSISHKTRENMHKNVNENMFSFTFYANFHASVTFKHFYSDFHEIFIIM